MILDTRRDYSFLDTPLRNASNPIISSTEEPGGDEAQAVDASGVILRIPEPNPNITAYANGSLAWGIVPGGVQSNASVSPEPSFPSPPPPRLPFMGFNCRQQDPSLGGGEVIVIT